MPAGRGGGMLAGLDGGALGCWGGAGGEEPRGSLTMNAA
jgi:hypothetical protein